MVAVFFAGYELLKLVHLFNSGRSVPSWRKRSRLRFLVRGIAQSNGGTGAMKARFRRIRYREYGSATAPAPWRTRTPPGTENVRSARTPRRNCGPGHGATGRFRAAPPRETVGRTPTKAAHLHTPP